MDIIDEYYVNNNTNKQQILSNIYDPNTHQIIAPNSYINDEDDEKLNEIDDTEHPAGYTQFTMWYQCKIR